MTNKVIAASFKLLGQLLEIYGEDSFKIKSYLNAARTFEKLPVEIASLPEDKIFTIIGIGKAIGSKTIELLQTGRFKMLQEYMDKTPPGIIEMLKIKGLGPKKIITIWQELEIESIGELLYACNENRLMLYKGFGQKTQDNIREAIEFYLSSQGRYLFAEIEKTAVSLNNYFEKNFASCHFTPTGEFIRQAVIIDHLQWITDAPQSVLSKIFEENNLVVDFQSEEIIKTKTPGNVSLHFICATKNNFASLLFKYNCSERFYETILQQFPQTATKHYTSEKEIFMENGLQYIPPFLREQSKWIDIASKNALPSVIKKEDVRGIIHAHSKWSDGANTLREMAEGALAKGFEYLVITDHSQSAFYASGLKPESILAQHREIDELNQILAPFRIFKGIESDILYDGRLDYTDDVLASFDLIIASVHSNLKMDEAKAMMRLTKAIENPYTNILGHPTGRLLLSRPGYPLDVKEIIDACAANKVVIELNANPRRLDIDWHWIDYALEKNVLIAVDPDAHSIAGMEDVRFGILAAQKAGVSAQQNLSSYSLPELELFIQSQKAKRG